MINLTLNREHLIFNPFITNLPDLTIITGINGSGKTHLLKAIKSNIISNDITNDINSIQLIDNTSFRLEHTQLDRSWSTDDFHYVDLFQSYSNLLEEGYDFTSKERIHPYYAKIEKIALLAKKDINNLSQRDFQEHHPIHIGSNDFFSLDFFKICLKYAQRLEENNFNQFKNLGQGKSEISYHTDEEFIRYYGKAPWTYISEVFESFDINYIVETSDLDQYSKNFFVNFVHKVTGAKLQFQSLSTGEQVIILTALSVYNLEHDLPFPQILLMDEPDASLHPSMIKHFLKVVEVIFVKEKGMKVLITTHNPTTVALASEESIYTMSGQTTNTVIEKNSKDSALKILTEGVPSFSVNYENRRQIFVESNNDVKYYDKFYTVLKNELEKDISLYFLSSGVGPNDKNGMPISNCDQVQKVTSILRDNGNNFVWGIVDWDLNEKGVDCKFVKILGENKRYGIENYIFDPIAIAAFLLKRKLISKEELNLSTHETYLDFKTFNNEKLQNICNKIIEKLEPFRENAEKLAKRSAEDIAAENILLNKKIYNIPLWINELRGHYLEDEVYLKAFPELEKIKNKREEKLKLQIINEVYLEIPEIIPQDIIELFKELQTL